MIVALPGLFSYLFFSSSSAVLKSLFQFLIDIIYKNDDMSVHMYILIYIDNF